MKNEYNISPGVPIKYSHIIYIHSYKLMVKLIRVQTLNCVNCGFKPRSRSSIYQVKSTFFDCALNIIFIIMFIRYVFSCILLNSVLKNKHYESKVNKNLMQHQGNRQIISYIPKSQFIKFVSKITYSHQLSLHSASINLR